MNVVFICISGPPKTIGKKPYIFYPATGDGFSVWPWMFLLDKDVAGGKLSSDLAPFLTKLRLAASEATDWGGIKGQIDDSNVRMDGSNLFWRAVMFKLEVVAGL